MRPHIKYARYVARHKWFVLLAGLRTGAPLWRLLVHDWSKLSRAEWRPYAMMFYAAAGETPAGKAAFDAAWLHHQHHNPHHWQHWVLRKDDGRAFTLSMPVALVREMVADWMGAGRAITGTWEVHRWYAANSHEMLLHPDTRAQVERVIS